MNLEINGISNSDNKEKYQDENLNNEEDIKKININD